MKTIRTRPLIALFAVQTALCFAAGCNGKAPELNSISVSILPQKYFAEKITGGKYPVEVMVPPGHNPETFEAGHKQMKAISHSFLYFRIGLIPLETGQMDRFASVNPKMKITDTSEGVSFIVSEEGHEGADPHIWLSPKEVRIIARNMLNALVREVPEEAELFNQGFASLMAEVDAADKMLSDKLSPHAGKSFICFHPSWSYLARDYGLRQISVEQNGKEPSPARIKFIEDIARKENIRVVLLEEQFPTELARAMAKDIGGNVVQTNPLAENWPAMMKNTASALAYAVSQAAASGKAE